MSGKLKITGSAAAWIALALLVVPMFGSYFFDDMFSTVSFIFNDPSALQLGWGQEQYGQYTSGYSILCIFGGLVLCGMLLDKWGVRITGSIFVGLMVAGAAMITWAVSSTLPASQSLAVAWVGCMFFGLGSEIAGVAVTRSIAKWFKGRGMAFAMGLQLAIARLGTATAFLLSPVLIQQKDFYTLAETARPALFGMMLLLVGAIFWAIFVTMDARFDRALRAMPREDSSSAAGADRASSSESKQFRFKDLLKVLSNPEWWLLALLCVFFYSSIIAFKKFTGAILVPRFGVSAGVAGLMATILPFSTVVFAPLFGLMVDRRGNGTRWMVFGAVLALAAHLILSFAPSGNAFWGYAAMVLLGFSYSLVPAALWPSVPKVIPDRMLGTAFALIYWVQNLGLWGFKRLAGRILESASTGRSPILNVELMFLGVCVAALVLAVLFAVSSRRHPELALDKANK